MAPLAFGLYERLITRALEAELDALQRDGAAVARVAPLDPAEAHAIGQAHRQFRFDLRYRAVTGATRTEVEKQIQQGFRSSRPVARYTWTGWLRTSCFGTSGRPSRRVGQPWSASCGRCWSRSASVGARRPCASSWTKPGWSWATSTSLAAGPA